MQSNKHENKPIPFDEALKRMVQAPPKPVKKDAEKKGESKQTD